MAAPIRPAGTKVYGKEKWAYVPAIADTSAPTDTELSAAGAVDMSCYFFSDSAKPSVSQDGVTAPARICDTQQFQNLGTAQWSGGNAMYAVDPQGVAASDGRKAYEALPDGTTGFLVKRVGIAYDTDFTAADVVSVYPAAFGVPVDVTEGDGEAAEVAIQQAYVISGPPAIFATVAAGV